MIFLNIRIARHKHYSQSLFTHISIFPFPFSPSSLLLPFFSPSPSSILLFPLLTLFLSPRSRALSSILFLLPLSPLSLLNSPFPLFLFLSPFHSFLFLSRSLLLSSFFPFYFLFTPPSPPFSREETEAAGETRVAEATDGAGDDQVVACPTVLNQLFASHQRADGRCVS